ncbi:MAG: aminoglycoside phosphotransferase family protein [Oscillospiraceae bacterium]
MQDILKNFRLNGKVTQCSEYGCGHINRTYLVLTDSGKRYILQGISTVAFKDVPGLMENIGAVTRHLQKKVKSERECLHLVPTLDGADYWYDGKEGYCRVYDFIEDSICLQSAETPEDFYQSAVAFGTFQRQLEDFPAQTLHETIVNFHNTPDRYEKFKAVLAQDKLGRVKDAEYEIGEYLKREQDGVTLMNMLKDGRLPLRVTHNDTKLNNVMLDAKTRKALCVIDLDTVMPGLMAFDFGDSIRFGAATAAEDERDLSKVSMSLELFKTFAKGFISSCPELTQEEYTSLAWGARIMTLECGVRFLTDYLDGDKYFAVHRPGQNLDRCRTQLKMVQDMEGKWDKMLKIIRDLRQ